MPHGVEALADEMEDLGIRLDGWTGEILGPDQDGCHGFGGEQLSDALVARDGYLDVCGIGQPVGVDQRLVGHVGGGDADVATGERRDESDGDRGVVVAVIGATGDVVVLVSEVASSAKKFDLGPVGGESSKSGRGLVGERFPGRGWNFLPCCER